MSAELSVTRTRVQETTANSKGKCRKLWILNEAGTGMMILGMLCMMRMRWFR